MEQTPKGNSRNDLTVQIMLGGKSLRMGMDKALARLGNRTLLELAVEKWQGFGTALQLSVGPAERRRLVPAGVEAVADVYPERGPLGGLHAGLRVCRTEFMLLTAVDCPFVTRELAQGLAERIGELDACVYTLEGRPQPLFGLYRKSCAAAAERMLQAGDNRMKGLLERVGTVYVPARDARPFRNLNTPEELEQARMWL